MTQESMSADAAAAALPIARPTAKARKPFVAALAVLALGGAAGRYWLYARHFEDTDDAQVDGSISNVSPKISGNVRTVYVVENQRVKAGDLLAEIDPADLQIAVDQAKAQVAQAHALLEVENQTVPITLTSNDSAVATARSDLAAAQASVAAASKDVQRLTAQLTQAQANDRTAQLERERAEKLVAQGAVSQADYDTRLNAAAASAASLEALKESLAAANDRVMQQQAQIVAFRSHAVEIDQNAPRHVQARKASVIVREAALDLARAQLAQAERNLSYAKIVAPVAGIVAKKSLAIGDHVQPGQLVIAITQVDSLWVTANYRETQLALIEAGQTAVVHVDALDLDLHGTVESVGGATGSRLSILPPENASGNYVKVVQRVPVRIKLDAGQTGLDRLRLGMSVEPKVTVR